MRRGLRHTLAAATVVLMGVLAACGNGEDGPRGASGSGSASGSDEEHHDHGGGGEPAFDRAGADTGVDVVLRDFAIDGLPAAVKGTKVFFSARNDGQAEHELVIVHEDGKEIGAIPPFAKGGPKELAVELPPGRYRAQCLVREGARTHAELGMQADFTVE